MRFLIKPTYEEEIVKLVSAAAPQKTAKVKILDIGSGKGRLAKMLFDKGYDVCASDLFPENFSHPQIRCEKIDVNRPLPFADGSFDVITASEVYEHLENHMAFARECRRVLRPSGQLIFSTPNILNLKSRTGFLLSGYHAGLGPIVGLEFDPKEFHISPEPLYQIVTVFDLNGFSWEGTSSSYWKESCMVWLWLYPLIWFFSGMKMGIGKNENQTDANRKLRKAMLSMDLLLGRTLVIKLVKK
jgi:SAM-dependent methyltransferase